MEELTSKDKEWRLLALKICGCKSLADDLVQDMYLKLILRASNGETFNKAYIYYTLKHLYVTTLRNSKKEILVDDFTLINRKKNQEEAYVTQQRYELLEMVKDLSLWEREVLFITHEKSLRQAEDETGIHYGVLNYAKHKALDKLKAKYNGSTKRQKK